MNNDVLTSIMMPLDINDVINLCQMNHHYHHFCHNRTFWQLYFAHHGKTIPHQYHPETVMDWKLLYEYNDFLAFAGLQNWRDFFRNVHHYYNVAVDIINKNMDNEYVLRMKPTPYEQLVYKLLAQLTQSSNTFHQTITDINFDFEDDYIIVYYYDDMDKNKHGLKIDGVFTRQEIIMILIAILMEKNYKRYIHKSLGHSSDDESMEAEHKKLAKRSKCIIS